MIRYIILFLLFFPKLGFSLKIVVDKGVASAQSIAVVPFRSTSRIHNMAKTIASDLKLSGRFQPVSVRKMPSKPSSINNIRFKDWQTLTGIIVVGSVTKSGAYYKVSVNLVDIYKRQAIDTYNYTLQDVNISTLRKVGHKLSDLIYKKLTSLPGFFSTKISFVSEENGYGGKKNYTLNLSDIDGNNSRVIFRSLHPILSPTWSPDGSKIAFVSFILGKADILIKNLRTGKVHRVTNFNSNSSSPDWSPNGRKLALTLNKDGNSEIYTTDMRGHFKRITRSRGADTEATWSPDGRYLYFLSDRSGSPQIYKKSVNGSYIKKITRSGSYNASPDVSPDGRYLTFLHKLNHRYVVAVKDLRTGKVVIVSETNSDESPSFAPNSDMIVYATEKRGKGVLTITNKYGTVHKIYSSIKSNIREPQWSPYIK